MDWITASLIMIIGLLVVGDLYLIAHHQQLIRLLTDLATMLGEWYEDAMEE